MERREEVIETYRIAYDLQVLLLVHCPDVGAEVLYLVQELQGEGETTVLWWSLALGADLGGNATAVGASANVVVTGIAARQGHPISFWRFTRYGLVVTTVTILLSWPYLWLRYFVFA